MLLQVPPFNIFVSEFMILADGFSSGSVLSIVFSSLLVIGIVLIFIGFINNMFKMIFGSPTTDIPRVR